MPTQRVHLGALGDDELLDTDAARNSAAIARPRLRDAPTIRAVGGCRSAELGSTALSLSSVKCNVVKYSAAV